MLRLPHVYSVQTDSVVRRGSLTDPQTLAMKKVEFEVYGKVCNLDMPELRAA